jgi:methylmalonyl-CoA/ethylmalonyl-CoA epimerase
MSEQPDDGYAAVRAATGGLLAGLVTGIDHIGVCVADMDAAGAAWANLLGAPMVDREDVVAQKTTAGFVRFAGQASSVELVCPMPGNAGLDGFLARRGDAMHHIAFAVSDIHSALDRLAAADIRLIDRTPRPGAGGHLVAFLHPKAMNGTLVELVQPHAPSETP